MDEAELTEGAIYVCNKRGRSNGSGTIRSPFQTVAQGLSALQPGGTMYIRGGLYSESISIPPRLAGLSIVAPCDNDFNFDTGGCVNGCLGALSPDAECTLNELGNTVISAYPGETPVFRHVGGGTSFSFAGVGNFTVNGLTFEGGASGISNQRNRYAENASGFENIYITNNTVRYTGQGDGGNSIRIYNQSGNANENNALRNVVVSGNHVHDGRSGTTETFVTNGNIEGIRVFDNVIHNNNNIGFDFIGYEGGSNQFNRARHVLAFNNIVFGIKTINGASMYKSDGGERPRPLGNYDPCSVGVYVDGGTKIRIFNNLIFDCDIGIEVACERTTVGVGSFPFTKTDVHVHDNIITHSYGEGGIAIGGYNSHRTTSHGLVIENNILYSDRTAFLIQKARDNIIRNNIIVSEQPPYGRIQTDGRWSPWPGAAFDSSGNEPQNLFTIEDLRNQPALDFWGENLWYTDNPVSFAEGNYGPDPRSFGMYTIALGYWDGNLIYDRDGQLVSLGNGTYIWNQSESVLSHIELARLSGGILKGMRELADGTRNPNAPPEIRQKAAENLSRQMILESNPLVDPSNGDFSLKPEFAALYPDMGTDPAKWDRPLAQKWLELYSGFTTARHEVFAAREFLETTKFDFMDAGDNLNNYLTKQLREAGFENSEVLYTISSAPDNMFGQPFQDTMSSASAAGGLDGATGINTIVSFDGQSGENVPWKRPDNKSTGWINGNIDTRRRDLWKSDLEDGRVKEFAYLVMVITRFGDEICPTSGKPVAYTATGTYSYDGGVRMFITRV